MSKSVQTRRCTWSSSRSRRNWLVSRLKSNGLFSQEIQTCQAKIQELECKLGIDKDGLDSSLTGDPAAGTAIARLQLLLSRQVQNAQKAEAEHAIKAASIEAETARLQAEQATLDKLHLWRLA